MYKRQDSLTEIGIAAFSFCAALTDIRLPASITEISAGLFSGCSSLATLEIPDSVTIIGGDAFVGCTSLTSMTIPDSVTEIGANPFPRSGLQSITLSLDNPTFAVVDGALVRKADNTLLSYFCGRQDAAYTIPQGILAIGDNAFAYVDSLQSITIPDSVTSIGHSAFLFCRGLTDVTIPDSVTHISQKAFSCCFQLTSITLPSGLTAIESGTFDLCKSLTTIDIPDSVAAIADDAFIGCKALQSFTLSPNHPYFFLADGALCRTVDNTLLFYPNARENRTYRIPDGIAAISAYAFYDCDLLDEILDILVDTVCSTRKMIRIGGEDYPKEVVKSRLLKLDSGHIEYVISSLHENTTKVRNIRAYLLTSLYNAPTTINSYYTALVNHDMYGSG